MKKYPLISVVIPTFNRAHLIQDTLDSILAQTYQNWECLVIDDGSTDNTSEILEEYIANDKRFKFFKRTETYLSGGNGARNYGLDLAQGDFIVFFDSDDKMTEDHLQVKVDLINSGDFDFGITRTKYFNYTNKNIDRYYNFTSKDITKENYILQKLNWLTLDVIIKASIAKSIRFNENIKIGQEYNFFCKLVCITTKGVFLNKVVSLRRHHDNSKRTTLAKGAEYHKNQSVTNWYIFYDTKENLSLENQKFLLNKAYNTVLKHKKIAQGINSSTFWLQIFKYFKFKAIIKLLYFYINKVTNRMYFLRRLALKL
jgi:glycosyltransferase involved in cell wall biosynthesis